MTDTTGTKENGFGYYLDMVINNVPDTVIYNLKFEKDDDDGKTHRTTVEIIGAFTKKNDLQLGGYGIKEDGVKNMVKEFDSVLLISLKKEQEMIIRPF